MKITQRLVTIILPIILLLPTIANANVARPALEIAQFSGDSGAVLTGDMTAGFNFNINATTFTIVTSDPANPIDIADQSFSLHGFLADPSVTNPVFTGSFNVSGGLLAGTFQDLTVGFLSNNDIMFDANLTYTSGSLKGNLTGGRIEGGQNAAGTQLAAKLGPVTVVPVPAAIWLFGSGLLGLAGIARRKA